MAIQLAKLANHVNLSVVDAQVLIITCVNYALVGTT